MKYIFGAYGCFIYEEEALIIFEFMEVVDRKKYTVNINVLCLIIN